MISELIRQRGETPFFENGNNVERHLYGDSRRLFAASLGKLDTLSQGRSFINIPSELIPLHEELISNNNYKLAESRGGIDLVSVFGINEIFFLPEHGKTWLDQWINFATPEEIENEFAFYLGAGYINSLEYAALIESLTISRLIHSNQKRRDGIRRSLHGHILPGLRYVFDNREEVINDILLNDSDDQSSFFEHIFAIMSHDWYEDVEDFEIKRIIEGQFPNHLLEIIDSLTHKKRDGQSLEEYVEKVRTSKRAAKFAKMVDRQMNVLDDIGKAPPIAIIKNPEVRTRSIEYINETREKYLPIFEDSELPLIDKFKETLDYVEKDFNNSIEFLRILDRIIVNWIIRKNKRQFRYRQRKDAYVHIMRMIEDLQENASIYGVNNTSGIIGGIYMHDFIEDIDFQNMLRERMKGLKPDIEEIFVYSMACAHSSRAMEDDTEIGHEQVEKIYNLSQEEGLVPEFNQALIDVFSKRPIEGNKKKVDKRKKLFPYFKKHEIEFYKLRPVNISVKSMKDAIHLDLEGSIILALEMIDKIKYPPKFDPTYVWRQLQEIQYNVIPLLESYGLKELQKYIADIVDVETYSKILGESGLKTALQALEDIRKVEYETVNNFEKIINRLFGGRSLIEYDRKGLSAVNKLVQDGRTVITDLSRCRIVLPKQLSEEDLLAEALDMVESIIIEFKSNTVIDGETEIKVNRPYEVVDGKLAKLPIRISLEEVDRLQNQEMLDRIGRINSLIGNEEDYKLFEFVKRETGYKDVKIVFEIKRPGKESVYYEIIITNFTFHKNNTFGEASRNAKKLHDMNEEMKTITNNVEWLKILESLYMRAALYKMMSSRGLYVSPRSSNWLKGKKLARQSSRKGDDMLRRIRGIMTSNSSNLFT